MRQPSFRILINDVLIALALLTRLPVPYANFDDETRPAAEAAWAYPIAGLVVGFIAVAIGTLAMALSLPPAIVALLVLATLLLCTGAMHEDGLADCADGFWGGQSREHRLDIMKDSQIGTYGVAALMVVFLLRWTALTALITAGFLWGPVVATAVISRSAMAYVMDILPNARGTGLSHLTGRPNKTAIHVAVGIATVVAVFTFGWFGLLLIALSAIALLGCAGLARHKIGGQTGDVLGASQQIVEAVLLVAMTTLL